MIFQKSIANILLNALVETTQLRGAIPGITWEKIKNKHGENDYAKKYYAAIDFIKLQLGV
jgi:hypothetical protein